MVKYKNIKANEDEEVIGVIRKPSQVLMRSLQSVEYTVYFHGPIGSPDEYLEHFAVYQGANSNDLIRLYINSNGGNLATALEYIRHMRHCAAPIIGVIGLNCASGASAVALSCDAWEIDDFSTCLVHGFSYGAEGNAFAVSNQVAFNSALNERWVRKTYEDFLTEEEIKDALRGVDILIDSESLDERLAHLVEIRDKIEEEQDECIEQ